MPKIAYHLIDPKSLPDDFWQTTNEDQETITRLETLEHSIWRYGFCWIVWNKDDQALYEQRDLYQCSVVGVVEHDVIRGKATPCGDLCRREPLPIFFSISQLYQIISSQPQQIQSCIRSHQLEAGQTVRSLVTGQHYQIIDASDRQRIWIAPVDATHPMFPVSDGKTFALVE